MSPTDSAELSAHAAGLSVDVVVPVHGGWAHTDRCLRALTEQTMPCRIIVVDDLSPDDTAEQIAAAYPDIELVRNAVNLGFARTCNVGMRRGTGDIVILVNSDVEAAPDLIETVAHTFADAAEKAGSIAAALLQPNGTVDSYGIVADPTGAGFVRFHGAALESIDASEPPVLGPYGAAAIYRRQALDEVGLLDENIFMYGEELDLAFRLRAAGWDCISLPRVVGTHIGGGSAGVESERQRYLSGFARGYLLRVYGVLRTRVAVRAVVTEAIVTAVRLVSRRDATSLRGRIAGWRRAKGVAPRTLPSRALDARIGFRKSLQMRSAGYWANLPRAAQRNVSGS